ncbi:MAG: Gfo/Idh/MocA family oxidoreductase [Bacillota bacterium]|nr:Gfo/Idh/MocA family oxidoreductase [Bacillota bacterium]
MKESKNGKLKAAIIGAGIYGKVHARIYSEIPYVETVAICDIDQEKATQVAKEFNIPQIFTDYNELLKKSGCDFVAITTPDHVHGAITIAAANAKKHIILEKPFATKRDDIIKMREAIFCNGIRAMCDLPNRSSQPFAITKQMIDSGEYGKVYSMYIRLNDSKSVATDMLSWSSFSSPLWFLGSHSLDLISYLCGSRPKMVYALSRKGILQAMGIDTVDIYQTCIEFENGCIAQMENGWIVPNGNTVVYDLKCNILCEHGAFNINASDSDMLKVISEQKTSTPGCIARSIINNRIEGFVPINIQSFVDALYTDKPFNITIDEAADSCMALLAIIESALKGEPIHVQY